MSLARGVHLGAYDIISLVGAGGMGEVYRARDTRLNRDVAIKILSGSYAQHAGRRKRFEQEARSAAALNHPSILAVYDVGQVHTPEATPPVIPYIVTELLEGETLKSRIELGPLPWRKAVQIAAAIADGVAAAHARGIVHGDLKPANIFLTSDGRVKILDFGLAKLRDEDGETPSDVTVTTAEPGIPIGTVAYMAPEQISGLPTDSRTDVFALGSVLYEMLSARRPFANATVAGTMAAILQGEPGELTGVPSDVQRTVAHCLEKNLDERFQSARDLSFDLTGILEGRRAGHTGFRFATVWKRFAAAGLLVLGAGWLASMYSKGVAVPPRRETALRSSLLIRDGRLANFERDTVALSPDGTQIAYSARAEAGRPPSLWVMTLSSGMVSSLGGTDNALFPFWSPDNRHLAFFADQRLKKIDVRGGPPQDLCEGVLAPGGGSWGSGGEIVFAGIAGHGLYQTKEMGGGCSPLTHLDDEMRTTTHASPAFLPDGRRFLYFARSDDSHRTGIYLASLTAGASTFLIAASAPAQYVDPGFLLFPRGNQLLAASFDPDVGRVSDEPSIVADRIFVQTRGRAVASASSTNLLAYVAMREPALETLAWVDRERRATDVLQLRSRRVSRLSWSGHYLAVAEADDTGNIDIWMYDLERPGKRRLTFQPGADELPIWGSDDETVIYSSQRDGRLADIYEVDVRSPGHERLVYASDEADNATSISKDGRLLIFNAGVGPRQDLYSLDMTTRTATRLTNTPFSETGGEISPDGRWVAYGSTESGPNEVYVRGLMPADQRWLVSADIGRLPRWRADGRELYYESNDAIMAVPVGPENPPILGRPFVALQLTPQFPISFSYNVSRDGRRFLIRRYPRDEGTLPITLVQNWTELLRK